MPHHTPPALATFPGFENFTDCQRLDIDADVAAHKGIVLADGRHSWYNGHYHRDPFHERVRYSFPDDDTLLDKPLDRLFVGNFCQIASGAAFMLGGNHGHDVHALTAHGFNFMPGAAFLWEPAGDIVLGHDVWIGYEALVMSGVRIGHGAIIGARAMVTRDVPPYAVVVGTDRIARFRFDEAERALMQRIAWWSWDDTRIQEALPLLQGRDVHALARFAGIAADAPELA